MIKRGATGAARGIEMLRQKPAIVVEIVDVPLSDATEARRDVPVAWIEAGRVVG